MSEKYIIFKNNFSHTHAYKKVTTLFHKMNIMLLLSLKNKIKKYAWIKSCWFLKISIYTHMYLKKVIVAFYKII
jgi:hypothetical protein